MAKKVDLNQIVDPNEPPATPPPVEDEHPDLTDPALPGPADLIREPPVSSAVRPEEVANDEAVEAVFQSVPFRSDASQNVHYMRVREKLVMIGNVVEYMRVDARTAIRQGTSHLIVRGMRYTQYGVIAVTYSQSAIPKWILVPHANVSFVSPKA